MNFAITYKVSDPWKGAAELLQLPVFMGVVNQLSRSAEVPASVADNRFLLKEVE